MSPQTKAGLVVRRLATREVRPSAYGRKALRTGLRAGVRTPFGRRTLQAASAVGMTVRSRRLTTVRYEPEIDAFVYRSGGVVMGSTLPTTVSAQACADFLSDNFLRHYAVRAGDVVVELGAGTGTETVALAGLVGPSGRVVAVEANPRVAAVLRRTLALNGLSQVDVVEAAVSDVPGMLSFVDDVAHVGGHVESSVAGRGRPTLHVRAITLDDLVVTHNLTSIDLLKVNIEGGEVPAFLGGSRALALTRNAVVSCHDFKAERTGDPFFRTRQRILDLLHECGFTVLPAPSTGPGWRVNTVFGRRNAGLPAPSPEVS